MVAWCGAVLGELHATFAESSPGGTHALPLIAPPVAQPLTPPVAPPVAQPVAPPVAQPVAPPVAQPLARQWRASGLTRWIPSPQTTCPSPTVTDQGTTHRLAMKQPPPIPTFPHQQAEKSPQKQHVLSFNPKSPHNQHVLSFNPVNPRDEDGGRGGVPLVGTRGFLGATGK